MVAAFSHGGVLAWLSAPWRACAQTLPGGFRSSAAISTPPSIQDIRYATANNFVGRKLAGYEARECVVKRGAAPR